MAPPRHVFKPLAFGMWKIKNTTNYRLLDRLDKTLVRPLLRCIVGASTTQSSVRQSIEYLSLKGATRSVVDISLSKKINGRSLEDVLNRFASKSTRTQATQVASLYFAQRREVHGGRYGIPIRDVPPEINTAFSKYLYDELFDDPDIWTQLRSPGFNRAVFHKNFRTDNRFPSSCPYCDLDTINGEGNYVVEHFLPRKHFPLLALDPFNLFTACNSCNTSGAGKGTRVEPSAGTPYFIQAGDHLRFVRDDASQKVTLTAERSFPPVSGLIGLLSLELRYGTENVYHQLRGRTRALEQALDQHHRLEGHPLPRSEVTGYISSFNAGAPLFFALCSWARHEYIP